MRPLIAALIAATFASYLPSHDASAIEYTGPDKVWPIDPPFKYCDSTFSWLAGGSNVSGWRYYVQGLPADFGKLAYVFIAFRRRSVPDQFWFTDGAGNWRLLDATHLPLYVRPINVQPVNFIFVQMNPDVLDAFINDGEFWVGYGLRSGSDSATSVAESYAEMLASKRYWMFWSVNQSKVPLPDFYCLRVTAIGWEPPVVLLMPTRP